MSVLSRLKTAMSVFRGEDPLYLQVPRDIGPASALRPDQVRLTSYNWSSVVAPVYNRIAIDVSALDFHHVRLDEEGNFKSIIDSDLNTCLSLKANIDQCARAFIRDVVLSMFDEGAVAIVPTGNSLRVGKVVQWYPEYVQLRVYNQHTGFPQEVIVHKEDVGIIENPFYNVMNEPNSTAKRLARKLSLMDRVDEDIGSGKIDLVVQMPYSTNSKIRQREIKQRLKDIDRQIAGRKYGIIYLDATERITQLNRPVDNHFVEEVNNLRVQLYNELGVTEDVINGKADETQENNYYVKTIEPIASTITQVMSIAFLTQTARSQRQSIMYFRNPFKLMPAEAFATVADRLTRNEIMSSNEIRSVIGLRPSDDPRADQLINKNLRQPEDNNAQNEIENKKEEQSDGKQK